jgi:hypothetical protein
MVEYFSIFLNFFLYNCQVVNIATTLIKVRIQWLIKFVFSQYQKTPGLKVEVTWTCLENGLSVPDMITVYLTWVGQQHTLRRPVNLSFSAIWWVRLLDQHDKLYYYSSVFGSKTVLKKNGPQSRHPLSLLYHCTHQTQQQSVDPPLSAGVGQLDRWTGPDNGKHSKRKS